MTQLEEAQYNLDRCREEFKDDPDLLACYEPSLKWFVELLKEPNRDE